MESPIIVSSPMLRLPNVAVPPGPSGASLELLQQLVELQREQNAILRANQQAADEKTRWQNFFNRWSAEYPELPGRCKSTLPILERAYLDLLKEATDRLAEEDADERTSEYALADFLDKFGVKLSQLGHMIGQIGHLSNVTPPSDPAA